MIEMNSTDVNLDGVGGKGTEKESRVAPWVKLCSEIKVVSRRIRKVIGQLDAAVDASVGNMMEECK